LIQQNKNGAGEICRYFSDSILIHNNAIFFSKIFWRVVPDADKRNQYKAEQAAENRDISKSDSRAASWRNGIGWVCVWGMAYQLIIRDLLIWGAKQGYYTLAA